MREFASAGGELVIHAALHPKNSPTPQLVNHITISELSIQGLECPIKEFIYDTHRKPG